MRDIDKLDLKSNSRFVQFQLWRNCNCNCDFCYNKGMKDTDQVWSLKAIIDKIQQPIVSKFNEIGLIGGEIFGMYLEDEQVDKLFYQLIDIIIKRIKTSTVNKVYITSALLYKDTSTLYKFLNYIKDSQVIDKFLLCTSYDTKYRFKNENSVRLWETNVEKIHKDFPEVNIHTETILTNDFIKKVLDDQFNIKQFETKYKTKLNFIEPQCNSNVDTKEQFNEQLPDFLPERKLFIKFLHKIWKENQTSITEFLNEQLHSDLLYLECNGYLYEFMGRRRFPTLMDSYYRTIGRKFYHLGYCDSDILIEQDVEAFKASVL